MNRVSKGGRSIPRDRRAFSALVVVALGMVGSSLPTGCVKSPLLRQPDGPATPPEASTATSAAKQPAGPSGVISQKEADYGDRANSPSSGPPVPPTASPGLAAPLELRSAPTAVGPPAAEIPGSSVRPQPAIPPITAPANLMPEAPSTPLLDAAIERVTAIRGQQHDSLEPEPSPAEPDPTLRTSVSTSPILAAKASRLVTKPEPLPAPDSTDLGPVIVPSLIKHDDLLPPSRPPSVSPPPMAAEPPGPMSRPEKAAGAGAIDESKEIQKPEAPLPAVPATGDSHPAVPPTGDPDRLRIDKLRLCRKVHGFGSFEPIQRIAGESRPADSGLLRDDRNAVRSPGGFICLATLVEDRDPHRDRWQSRVDQ